MRILFFGTPDIAVPYLEELIKTEEVVGVITQPDKPADRGRHMHAPPVKTLAEKNSIPVFQPVKFTPEDVEKIQLLKADVGVVVSYGKLIPENIFTAPFYGCFNIHFSLLPKYRGAGPVQWALINGEKETGVTTFWIEKTLDSGPVLVQKKTVIAPEDDAPKLFEKLIPLGLVTMKETLERLKAGDCKGVAQQGEPTLAPCLKKETGKIDWSQPAEKIMNLIRGTKPWPGAYTIIGEGDMKGTRLKILKARTLETPAAADAITVGAGQVAGLEKNHSFIVKCGIGYLAVEEVHPENRKPVPAWDFWQGSRLKIGNKFS